LYVAGLTRGDSAPNLAHALGDVIVTTANSLLCILNIRDLVRHEHIGHEGVGIRTKADDDTDVSHDVRLLRESIIGPEVGIEECRQN
jgi:hypothetical protein